MAEKQPENFQHLVRVANTDLDGRKMIRIALRKIKGINYQFANMVCAVAGVPKNTQTGVLTNDQVEKLTSVIENPLAFDVPNWLFNRRRDPETGEDGHVITSDLAFAKENDLKRMKKTKSYKGVRHAKGLPVRGQQTKSNFRRTKAKGKSVIGVKKRAGAKSGR